jgi:DNA polymerase I
VLSALAKEHDLPRMILEFRGMQKLKNTYLDALPLMINSKTGRIHATFQQTGSETGRLASTDPNLQNIPVRSELGRSIRAAFKPGIDGWKILAADYSQIELRILAHYSGDEALLDAFRKGVDIHTAVAAKLFNVKEKDVSREQRSRTKAVNFGIIYGQSAFGLSGVLSIPRQEAQNIIDTYFANHPGVRRCIDEIIAQAKEQGYVTTVLGRRRFIPQLRASDRGARGLGERLAVNTVFQGSAADLIKKAMIEIQDTLQKEEWDAKMLLQIHDELLFEAPQNEVKKLAVMVKDKMEHALKLNVPITVDYGIGDDWLNAKD